MALTQVQPGMLASDSQYTGFKNKLINGQMQIDQRNAGASITANDGTYPVDRFRFTMATSSKGTGQQQTSVVPVGFSTALKFTSSAATTVGSTDFYCLEQYIEGYNFADFNFGTVNAKTVTISAWVYSSLTGTFGGSLQNADSSRSYPFAYSIPVANTWTQISVTIAGDQTGTWLTTNGIGAKLCFGLGVGSSRSNTAGVWATGWYASSTGATQVVATNGATFYLTGVQLEKGSTATSFDYRPYGTELQLCQRYYQTGSGTLNTYGANTEAYGFSVYFSVTKRATPTVTLSNVVNTNNTGGTAVNIAVDKFEGRATGNATARMGLSFDYTASSEL